MKRFCHERSFGWAKQVLSIIVFLAAVLAFSAVISGASSKTQAAQEQTLKLAVSRGIAHCYASEGRYPETLDSLLKNYDIYYDEELFFIDYQVLGENIFPDVTIIRK